MMNDNDKDRIDHLDRKIDVFMESLTERFRRWDELYTAVTGNAIDEKSGILRRIIQLEVGEKSMQKRIEKLEETNKRVFAYATAISFFVSSILGIIFTIVKMFR